MYWFCLFKDKPFKQDGVAQPLFRSHTILIKKYTKELFILGAHERFRQHALEQFKFNKVKVALEDTRLAFDETK